MKKLFAAILFACTALLAGCGAAAERQPGGTSRGGDVWTPPASAFIPEEPRIEEPALSKANYILCTADGLNVRTGAGTEYPSLGTAEKGTLLASDKETDGWIRTRFRGQTAYVCAKYTEPVSMEQGDGTLERVIEEGLRLLGTPYIYGAVRFHDGRGNLLKGFSEGAFDCSSLMQYIFYRGADVLLDVTTRTQILQGKRVERSEIRRGDLLFFTNASRKNKTGIERVGHVALYLGDGYILHTASDYAKIEKISPLRQSYFLEARRMV